MPVPANTTRYERHDYQARHLVAHWKTDSIKSLSLTHAQAVAGILTPFPLVFCIKVKKQGSKPATSAAMHPCKKQKKGITPFFMWLCFSVKRSYLVLCYADKVGFPGLFGFTFGHFDLTWLSSLYRFNFGLSLRFASGPGLHLFGYLLRFSYHLE